MTSPASDADQQWLRQSCASPASHTDTPPLRNGEALSGLGASKETGIVIPEDSDTEDEGYSEGEDPDSPQSYATTATSIANDFDIMNTKHSTTNADVAISMGTTPAESPAVVEGNSTQTHDSHLDSLADPEPNLQSLCQINPTSVDDTDFSTSSTDTKVQPCLTMSDEQLGTEAISNTPATCEPVAMIDAVSDEKSCGGSQQASMTPSRRTCSPIAAIPEVAAQAPLSDSEVCPSAERDDATSVRYPSSSPGLSPESPLEQDQDQDRRSFSSSDTESGSSKAESGSLLGARTYPPSCKGFSRRRSRRISLRTHKMVQDKNGATDTEGSDSEDGLNIPERGHDEDYCPSPLEVQEYDSGDDPDEGLNRRKRPKVSLSPYAVDVNALSSRQTRSTRSTSRLPRRRRASHSPALPQTGTVPSDVGTCVARFEEWPLINASLKRITEGNRTTFQLQFEWTPGSHQLHAQTAVPHPEDRESAPASPSRTTSSGGKWTAKEENIVRTMRQAGRSWDEIHRVLPHRSQGTIQVRYSTKLKHLPNSK